MRLNTQESHWPTPVKGKTSPQAEGDLMPHQSDTFKGWGTTGSSPGKRGGLFISRTSEFPGPDASTHQQNTCAFLRVRTPKACSKEAKGKGGRRWANGRKFPLRELRIWELALPRLAKHGQLVRRDSHPVLGDEFLLEFVVILSSLRQILPPPQASWATHLGLPEDCSTGTSLGFYSAPFYSSTCCGGFREDRTMF